MFALTDYDYHLPPELIAQQPCAQRDRCRLLVIDRQSDRRQHHYFNEIDNLLRPGDLMVVNNTAVIPGRLIGHKATGGQAEVLILNFSAAADITHCPLEFDCLVKTAKRPKPGTAFFFNQNVRAEVIDGEHGRYRLRFFFKGDFGDILEQIGITPLPPYIQRPHPYLPDRDQYQTVYAKHKGAIAAPTAGLHFTPDLLQRLARRQVTVVPVTLHVGYGTFLPVRVTDIRDHRMHAESFRISEDAAHAINQAHHQGRRIVAVGTTCVRTLEFACQNSGKIRPGGGDCDLFIYPGYSFKLVDAMITNFHLPQSTLMMLVSAFAGRQTILAAYQDAIAQKYRFFSYGDAMLIQ